jgi:hypothetical protein
MNTYKTLMNIKESIQNKNISYSEIAYLQDHKAEIKAIDDIELAQWAGISEEEWNEIIPF